ncbi:MAG: sigma-70 family RNA polymerase sigma factor [Acidimicrobiales bacterium]|nr:sigma-70 family RNA polymerase sigma factor [Acidimicrobiales bacterium]
MSSPEFNKGLAGGALVTTRANRDFEDLTDPFRRELLAHCYRMLGSVQDAEDLVQETYLRAWRSFDRFEGRSSLRVWLYKIATMACLTALEARRRRPLPSDLSAPSHDAGQALAPPEPGMVWLQPMPDGLIAAPGSDPAATINSQAGIRLAFIAALQMLSARQRAVLILRDVLSMRAAEVAEILDTTTVAVNSVLRRARAQLELSRLTEEELIEPSEAELREILDEYVDAFERSDITTLVGLLRADVVLEMPPIPTWFTGREAVAGFLGSRVMGDRGHWRLTPTRANGQPALATWGRGEDGRYGAHGVHVLTFIGDQIARITVFQTADLVPLFERIPWSS